MNQDRDQGMRSGGTGSGDSQEGVGRNAILYLPACSTLPAALGVEIKANFVEGQTRSPAGRHISLGTRRPTLNF